MKIPTEVLLERYKDNVFAAAFHICKNAADADDVVQDTFLQYYLSEKCFEDEQRIRSWLLRVAINRAKDINRSFWRRNRVSLDEYTETLQFKSDDSENLFAQVMKLPEKQRIVIHLYYYEDYSVREIAEILNLSESNIKIRLMRGRKLLREALKEEWDDDE
ncbi:MAG: RNA polymerase sigma factor [Lachnospiraceae bacterium]|nr:RNA polymerase sigma factor [Lachnospiraceae bacterium]MCD7764888.1 RNA polymerase sigma factor [Lachnospiraceae bacterium]